MKIVFVVNNKNNRLAKVLPVLEHYFRQAKMGRVEFRSTSRRQHAIELAKEGTEQGCDILVAVGGDGTLHEVINGVMQSDIPPDALPVIGFLPYGSANDFARTAGISNSIEGLHGLIQTRSIHNIDLGKITIHQTGESRYFINIAGVGLGAEVAQQMEGSSSFFGHGFNYYKHIIKGFLTYAKKEVHCITADRQWKGKLLQMAIANGRYFGNAICIAPDAIIDDGQFQVSIFGDLSLWDYIKNLGKLKRGEKINLPQVSYQDADELRLESNAPCGIEADGEYVGVLPATISLIPKAIRFLMPSESLVMHRTGE